MTGITRRHFLQVSAAAGAALGAPMLARESLAEELSFKPEPGAKLPAIAEAASGNLSVKEAIDKAEKRAKRYYR